MTDQILFYTERHGCLASTRQTSEPNGTPSEALVRTHSQNLSPLIPAHMLEFWFHVGCLLDVLKIKKMRSMRLIEEVLLMLVSNICIS